MQANTAKIVGTDTERIVQQVIRLLNDPAAYAGMANAVNPYGDGHAAERICERLLITSNEELTHTGEKKLSLAARVTVNDLGWIAKSDGED